MSPEFNDAMSDDILLKHKIEESGGIVFIRPHAQFPVFDAGEWTWSDTARGASSLPELNRYVELIGRTCYKSEHRITEGSASRFIRMLVDSGHESVVEHVSLTVKFVGSRAMSHQLVRHRLAAFSQESQRYVNYGKEEKLFAVMPPSARADAAKKEAFMRGVAATWGQYLDLLATGLKPEDARYLLPNAAKTEVVMTTNLRQWRHVIEERGLNTRAQWEIRMICMQVLDVFYTLLPEIFGDLREKRERDSELLCRDLADYIRNDIRD